jgi:hypothetical protein
MSQAAVSASNARHALSVQLVQTHDALVLFEKTLKTCRRIWRHQQQQRGGGHSKVPQSSSHAATAQTDAASVRAGDNSLRYAHQQTLVGYAHQQTLVGMEARGRVLREKWHSMAARIVYEANTRIEASGRAHAMANLRLDDSDWTRYGSPGKARTHVNDQDSHLVAANNRTPTSGHEDHDAEAARLWSSFDQLLSATGKLGSLLFGNLLADKVLHKDFAMHTPVKHAEASSCSIGMRITERPPHRVVELMKGAAAQKVRTIPYATKIILRKYIAKKPNHGSACSCQFKTKLWLAMPPHSLPLPV